MDRVAHCVGSVLIYADELFADASGTTRASCGRFHRPSERTVLTALRQSLSRPWLDVRLPAAPGFELRIVERPGLWMQTCELQALCSDMRGVAGRGLQSGVLDYGVFDVSSGALNRTIITCIRRRSDAQAVAFNALPVLDVVLDGKPIEVQHLGLVMIDPAVRSQGFSWALYGLTCFLLFVRGRLRPVWISNVTQVPAVVGMVATTFSDVYPDPVAGTRQSFAHRQIARQIMARHRQAFGVAEDAPFEASSSIIRDAYTGGSDDLKKTFEQAAAHRDMRYNDFCRESLDYRRGDDLLQLGIIDLSTLGRYVARAVPGRLLGPLLARVLVVLLRHVTLPVLHWLDASRPFGILRSRAR